jgi:hypothetical protein
MNKEKPVEVVDYYPTNLWSQVRVWQICGELVDFQSFVWFDKVSRTWERFGPESVFRLYEDGHVEVGV